MKKLIIIFLVFCNYYSFSQVFRKKEERHKTEVGIRLPYYFSLYSKDKSGTYYYHDFIFQTHLSYYPLQNLGFGISTDINLKKSNFSDIPDKYGIGIFTRFYMPVKFSPDFFKRLDFFIELKFDIKNYYWPEKEILTVFHGKGIEGTAFSLPIVEHKFIQQIFSIPIGIKYNISNNFYFEFSPVFVHDFHEKTEYLDFRYGIDYYFLSNRKKTLKIKEENKDFFNSFIAGSSVMYYNSKEYIQVDGTNYFFKFWLWNLNAAVSVNKRIFLGVQNFMFFADNAENEKNNYHLTGIFAQFDILRTAADKRIFFDLSLNNGNILFDFDKGPVFKKNTAYAGLGFGFDFPLKRISKKLSFDMSGYRYIILTNSNDGFSFNQYVLGLNYHFGKNQR